MLCSVVDNDAGAGLVIAQRGATAVLTESRFMSNAQGGVLAAAGACVTAHICQLGDNDGGPGVLATGVGTLAKLNSSILMANGLSAVVLCDAASAELSKSKASLSEGHGVEVRLYAQLYMHLVELRCAALSTCGVQQWHPLLPTGSATESTTLVTASALVISKCT